MVSKANRFYVAVYGMNGRKLLSEHFPVGRVAMYNVLRDHLDDVEIDPSMYIVVRRSVHTLTQGSV